MSERPHEWTREEVVALLQQVDLFEGLPHEDLNAIAAIVGGRTIEPGESLFEEGQPGDAFYIVFQGAIEISKTRADGTEEKLAVRRKGDGFGEMALLNEAPRSATARALERTQLVSVSRDDFQQLLGGDSLALRMMRRSPSDELYLPSLQRNVPGVWELGRIMPGKTSSKSPQYPVATKASSRFQSSCRATISLVSVCIVASRTCANKSLENRIVPTSTTSTITSVVSGGSLIAV